MRGYDVPVGFANRKFILFGFESEMLRCFFILYTTALVKTIHNSLSYLAQISFGRGIEATFASISIYQQVSESFQTIILSLWWARPNHYPGSTIIFLAYPDFTGIFKDKIT